MRHALMSLCKGNIEHGFYGSDGLAQIGEDPLKRILEIIPDYPVNQLYKLLPTQK